MIIGKRSQNKAYNSQGLCSLHGFSTENHKSSDVFELTPVEMEQVFGPISAYGYQVKGQHRAEQVIDDIAINYY